MFVYNARREDWIQENDVSVFANLRIRDTTVHSFTYSYRIKKFPLWRAFSKISGYDRKIRWTRVDGSRIRKKKKLRLHKFPDTCGRGLSFPNNFSLGGVIFCPKKRVLENVS